MCKRGGGDTVMLDRVILHNSFHRTLMELFYLYIGIIHEAFLCIYWYYS